MDQGRVDDDDHARCVGGECRRRILATEALEDALARIANVDLDEVRIRTGRGDLDVSESVRTAIDLLTDADALGWQALRQVFEEEQVARDGPPERAGPPRDRRSFPPAPDGRMA
jgi:hypothetical protein